MVTATAVYPDTPAADAGLHPGDTFLRIDGGIAMLRIDLDGGRTRPSRRNVGGAEGGSSE